MTGLTVPHTAHCLGTGDVMLSAMGDTDGNGKGNTDKLNYLAHACTAGVECLVCL